MSFLEVHELCKTYVRGKHHIHAVRNVGFNVEPGEMVCILGRSGSGKTTLLNLLGCLLRPTSGRIILEGEDLTALSPDTLPAIRREKIGFIFQQFNLLGHLSALENVSLPLRFSKVDRRRREERAARWLERLGLRDRMDFLPGELSGGEAQRVALARALVNNPRLLLADEPTAELDTQTGDDLIRVLQEVAAETEQTVLIVTHDARLASQAKRILTMRDGMIFAQEDFRVMQ